MNQTDSIDWEKLREHLAVFDGIPAERIHMSTIMAGSAFASLFERGDEEDTELCPLDNPQELAECGAVGCYIGWTCSYLNATGSEPVRTWMRHALLEYDYPSVASDLYGIPELAALDLFAPPIFMVHKDHQKRLLAFRMVEFFRLHSQPISAHWMKMASEFIYFYAEKIQANRKSSPNAPTWALA